MHYLSQVVFSGMCIWNPLDPPSCYEEVKVQLTLEILMLVIVYSWMSMSHYVSLLTCLKLCNHAEKIIFRSFFFIEDSYCAYVQKNKLSIILTINSLKIAILVLWWWWPPQGDGPSSSFQKLYLTRNVIPVTTADVDCDAAGAETTTRFAWFGITT